MSEQRITKACPFCGEQILEVAVKCKHCQSALTEFPVSDASVEANGSKSQGNRLPSAKVANELIGNNAREKIDHVMGYVVGVGILVAFVAGFYFYMQPGCETDSTKETLLRLLDRKFLHLSENGLDDKDILKSLENITKTSSNDNAKACMANLVLKFQKPVADHLRTLASSKGEPNFLDPQLMLKGYLQKNWNVAQNQLEVTLEYRYTKDSVMMGGGLEGLSLLGLEQVIKYVGKIKPELMAQSTNQNAKSAEIPAASDPIAQPTMQTDQQVSGNYCTAQAKVNSSDVEIDGSPREMASIRPKGESFTVSQKRMNKSGSKIQTICEKGGYCYPLRDFTLEGKCEPPIIAVFP